ncbi:MAG: hypothetical protein KatS3mg105_0373 [Gemmatales bacterium]|nr:MAG: hypothetical protein KatS3mg105_0373 [Gemmatales bacterium]
MREREITIFAGTETYVDLRPQKKSDIKGLTEFEPAWITVKVPDDAVIEINGRRTRSTGPVRTFETPPLEVGTTYHYTIRMTYTEGGKKVSRLRRIQFRPGEETIIDLRPSGL